jgi:hypothetical protein
MVTVQQAELLCDIRIGASYITLGALLNLPLSIDYI